MTKTDNTKILLLRRKEREIIKKIAEHDIVSSPTPLELSRELQAIQDQISLLQSADIPIIEVPEVEPEVKLKSKRRKKKNDKPNTEETTTED